MIQPGVIDFLKETKSKDKSYCSLSNSGNAQYTGEHLKKQY